MNSIAVFITWASGINHAREIVRELDTSPGIRTLEHRWYPVQDMDSFVKTVYSVDVVPWEHLMAKSEYLRAYLTSEVLISIALNLDPQVRMVGQGEFRHEQDVGIVCIKQRLRSIYNPSSAPEAHCIHASDTSDQAWKLLGLLALHGSTLLKTREVGSGYSRVMQIYHGNLVVNQLGSGLVPLTESICYGYMLGKVAEYEEYYSRHMGRELIDPHSPERYQQLIDRFEARVYRPIDVRDIGDGRYQIVDGAHRASILAYSGHPIHAGVVS